MQINQNRLLRILQIESKEAEAVGLAVLFALFIGMTQSFITSIPLAMFMVRYNISLLPYIFICIAAVTVIAGSAFSFFQQRISFIKLQAWSLVWMAISLIIFWFLLITLPFDWLSMALLIWGSAIYFFTCLISANLINQLFTLQQGKRFFGLIQASQALGGIIAGLAVSFLERSIGSNYIILFTSALLVLALINQNFICKKFIYRFEKKEKTSLPQGAVSEKYSFIKSKNRNYIILIFATTAFFVFQNFIIQMLFNAESKKTFTNEVDLASFYGVIWAVCDALNLFIGVFAFRWILEKIGIIGSLLFLPIIVCAFSILAYIFNIIPAQGILFFTFIVLTRVIDDSLQISISDDSVLLLFQPLNPIERIWAQAKNEVVIVPLATALAGIVLIIIDHFFGIRINTIVFLIVGISILGICLLLSLKNRYVEQLVKTLTQHVFVTPDLKKIGKESVEILQKCLKSPFQEEVIFGFNTLEELDRDIFFRELLIALDYGSAEVRRYALAKIEQYQIASAKAAIHKICMSEQETSILGSALIALGSICDATDHLLLKAKADDTRIEVSSSAIVALVKYGTPELKDYAIQRLTVMAASPEKKWKIAAATALKQVEISDVCDILHPLLHDSSLEVRSLSCQAVSHIVDEKIYPDLIKNLGTPGLRSSASTGLLAQGQHLIDYITRNFDQLPKTSQYELIRLIGKMPGDDGVTNFLRNYLTHSDKYLVHGVLHALTQHRYQATTDEQHMEIRKQLTLENENAKTITEKLSKVLYYDARLLQDVLYNEIALSQERLFLMLACIYPHDSIETAQEGFSTKDEDMVSYAIELLLRTLTPWDIKEIMPQLSTRWSAISRSTAAPTPEFSDILTKIMNDAPHYYISAIPSIAIYTIALLQMTQLTQVVREYKIGDDALARETTRWALERLTH